MARLEERSSARDRRLPSGSPFDTVASRAAQDEVRDRSGIPNPRLGRYAIRVGTKAKTAKTKRSFREAKRNVSQGAT
jgi:hypothetical protein